MPSGFAPGYWPSDEDFNKMIRDDHAIFAYGDLSRSDAYVAQIPALKEGESATVILTFIANRQGVFKGEIVQLLVPTDNSIALTTQGGAVTIR